MSVNNTKPLVDVGSEKALIAGLCQHGYDAYVDVCNIVDINTFTVTNNQMMFRCLVQLFTEGITKIDLASIISVAKTLNYEEILTKEKKDIEYLRALFSFPIYMENVKKQAVRLSQLHFARQCQLKHKEAYEKLNEIKGNEGFGHILGISESPIVELMSSMGILGDEEPKMIFEDIEEYIQDKFDNPIDCIGIPTPFPIYNQLIGGGLRRGVSLIVARAKIGKSTIGKETALYVTSKLNIPVLYVDTEMDESEQKDRSIASISKVDIGKIETGKVTDIEKERVLRQIQKLKGLKFYHKRVGGKDFDTILAIIKRWLHKAVGFNQDGTTKQHVIIYDYFKLMDTGDMKNMQEYQAIGYQFQQLNDFCNKYNTPVLAFAQSNRDGITNDTTAVISQSDRLLWFCISAFLYKRKTAEELAEDGYQNGNMKMIQLESRFGGRLDPGDYINYQADMQYNTMKELTTQRAAIKQARQGDTGFNNADIQPD